MSKSPQTGAKRVHADTQAGMAHEELLETVAARAYKYITRDDAVALNRLICGLTQEAAKRLEELVAPVTCETIATTAVRARRWQCASLLLMRGAPVDTTTLRVALTDTATPELASLTFDGEKALQPVRVQMAHVLAEHVNRSAETDITRAFVADMDAWWTICVNAPEIVRVLFVSPTEASANLLRQFAVSLPNLETVHFLPGTKLLQKDPILRTLAQAPIRHMTFCDEGPYYYHTSDADCDIPPPLGIESITARSESGRIVHWLQRHAKNMPKLSRVRLVLRTSDRSILVNDTLTRVIANALPVIVIDSLDLHVHLVFPGTPPELANADEQETDDGSGSKLQNTINAAVMLCRARRSVKLHVVVPRCDCAALGRLSLPVKSETVPAKWAESKWSLIVYVVGDMNEHPLPSKTRATFESGGWSVHVRPWASYAHV